LKYNLIRIHTLIYDIRGMKIIQLFVIGLFLFSGKTTWAQRSADELGRIVLGAYKYGTVEKLIAHFPSIEQLKSYSIKHQMPAGDELMIRLFETYPQTVSRFQESLEQIIEQGKTMGLDWSNIEVGEIISTVNHVPSADHENATFDLTRLEIGFTENNHPYRLRFANVIEIEGIWYLDNQVILQDLSEK
jgi:hypothetical protein